MIYTLILLDILINNFTKYSSFFFIIYLYNKSYKFFCLTGLILDFIIFDTFFYNTFILSVMFLLNKLLKDLNKNNFYNYVFITIYNYLLFIILSNLVVFNNLDYIFLSIGNNLLINFIFYILSFRIYNNLKTNN